MSTHRGFAVVVVTLMFLLTAILAAVTQTGDFPIGTYTSGPFTITFENGGTFRVVHSSGAGVTGAYKVSGDHIEFTDKDGEISCQGATGKYAWKLDGDRLAFTVIDDACDGRAEAVTTEPLVKKSGQGSDHAK